MNIYYLSRFSRRDVLGALRVVTLFSAPADLDLDLGVLALPLNMKLALH